MKNLTLQLWVIFILLYGIIKGVREPVKKQLLKELDLLTALFMYTFVGFLMTFPTATGVFTVTKPVFLMIILKSLVIFVAWMLSFKALKYVPVSIYGICDMSRMIFSTLLGVIFLGETLHIKNYISLFLVVLGLFLVNSKNSTKSENYKLKYIFLILIESFLNAVSAAFDKVIMGTGKVTSSALQFWFMLLLSVFYLGYILIKKEKLDIKGALKNPWLYVLSFSIVLSDRLLFIANKDPNSKITVMTLIKQSSVIVTVILGKILYKEKNILKKLACAGIVILGILIAVS